MINKKNFHPLVFLCVTLFVFLLSGCMNHNHFNQTEGNIADVSEHVTDARLRSNCSGKMRPPLIVSQGLYVDRTPMSLSRSPAWLKTRIIIRGDDLPFSYYARTIVNGGGRFVIMQYQQGLDQNMKISMNYTGPIKGALDLLAAKSGYLYSIDCRNINWQAYVTRTFDIAFMPGSSDYMMGKASGGGRATTTTGGSTTAQTVNAILDDSAASQYSNLKGTLSIWKDVETSIRQLLSPEGRLVVSEATTTVTVRDKPANVNLVSKFIANFNNNISRQVLVKVQILDVTLSSAYNFGINWNVVESAFGNGQYILNATLGTPVSITNISGGSIPQIGIQKSATGTGVGALINALSQQGKVSVVTEPRVVCLNNQVSAIRIVSQTGYLASVQNTTVAGTGGTGSTVTSQITPGTLVTGLTLYILPKIMGNKIYLQVNADLSNSLGIKTISSTTGATPSATSTSAAIQVPDVTQKQFNQRSVIASGDTLILAGFRSITNNTGADQLLGSQALGGQGSTQANEETIVLITPIILQGCA